MTWPIHGILIGTQWKLLSQFFFKEKHSDKSEKKKTNNLHLFSYLGLCQIGGNNLQQILLKSGPSICLICSDSSLCKKDMLLAGNSSISCPLTKSSHRVTFQSTWLNSRRGYLCSQWNTHSSYRASISWTPQSMATGFFFSLLGMDLSQRLWIKTSVWGESHNLENVKSPGASFLMMNQHKFFKRGHQYLSYKFENMKISSNL